MGSDFRQIDRLSRRQRRQAEPLGQLPSPTGVPKSRAEAIPAGGSSAEGSSGIASPLSEVGRSQVAYTLTSSDGMFVIEYPSEITYNDADGREVVIINAPV